MKTATFHTRDCKTSRLFRIFNGAQKCAKLLHLSLLELAAALSKISRVKIARHGAMTRAGATKSRTVRVQTLLRLFNGGVQKSVQKEWSQFSQK